MPAFLTEESGRPYERLALAEPARRQRTVNTKVLDP